MLCRKAIYLHKDHHVGSINKGERRDLTDLSYHWARTHSQNSHSGSTARLAALQNVMCCHELLGRASGASHAAVAVLKHVCWYVSGKGRVWVGKGRKGCFGGGTGENGREGLDLVAVVHPRSYPLVSKTPCPFLLLGHSPPKYVACVRAAP